MAILWELFKTFFTIGLFSFGGGFAMLPLIRLEVAVNHGWMTETEFIDMLAISEMTPGPIAVNTATFVGNGQAGVLGGLAATLAVVLPSFIIVSILFHFVKKFRGNRTVELFFRGLRVVVIGLIGAGFVSVLFDSITDLRGVLIAVITFVLVTYRKVHPVLAIVIAAGLGVLLYWG